MVFAERVARDIEQVWQNCATFNEPGSAVARLGLKAKTLVEESWVSEGLPLPSGGAADNGRRLQ